MLELSDVLNRMWTDLLARPSGPFAFRFLLQPMMAAVLALRDGIMDAKTARAPYFCTLLRDRERRRELLGAGLKATARVIGLGIAIDAAYQWKARGIVYPGEALGIALVLGFVPYLLIRGPADRIARRWLARKANTGVKADETGSE